MPPFLLIVLVAFGDQMLYGGCAFGEWAGDMRAHALENLAFFRKDGKYRLHLDKTTSIKGTEV